ncbi:MAG: peptidoglycan bridge formation glycyltransferase FemA/FemB family protein [Sphaerochaeta associata]|uniref:lipid II:glycine glycyltransferase FemX n=1 Tax=Sphaerochaeta associata TaxID=1129264 RepID=UPI002B207F9A|nr:peptidoglycan bridge formation glycyltransferase FemA/FemB family protein [Sphaerochaeta associata]MEA5029592.1 peptidoglycan bridge formation glycyltransferase FemA/FemB family protein [Sphaerochaeta associata]
MNVSVQEKEPAYLYDTPLLHQSSFWSQVKQKQGFETRAFDIKVRSEDLQGSPASAYVLDDVLVQLVPVNREQTIGYVPYGPVLSPQEDRMGLFLEELSMNLQEKLPGHCILLRYDLPWRTIWEDEDLSLPLQNLRLNWGTSRRSLHKSVSNQLPSDTMLIDLRPSEEEILARMHHKTRYNINLALRKGVEVRQVGHDHLDTFYDLYRETCERNRINLHDRSFFESLYGPTDESAGVVLLMAFHDGVPLSAMFLSRSKNRATYLYGASSSQMRNTMSTYALQWGAITMAKSWKCSEYDLFGVSPSEDRDHPMSGLYSFKKGFGGSLLHRMGCWDFAYNAEDAQNLFAYEMVGEGYHQS